MQGEELSEQAEKLACFARALIEALDIANMTRDELARRVGVSPSAVSTWTAGSKEPRPQTVFAIESAVGGSPGMLSRILGYCPCDTPVVGIQEAVMNDDRLTTDAKRNLVGLYRALVAVAGNGG